MALSINDLESRGLTINRRIIAGSDDDVATGPVRVFSLYASATAGSCVLQLHNAVNTAGSSVITIRALSSSGFVADIEFPAGGVLFDNLSIEVGGANTESTAVAYMVE